MDLSNIKMSSSMFWGILLIIIGLGIIFRVVFGFEFPILRFIIALFLIYLGIKVFFGNSGILNFKYKENDAVFKEISVKGNPEHDEYNVLFGKSEFDLRDINLDEGSVNLKVNTIFGNSMILVNENTPVRFRIDAVFADARLPNGNTAVIGNNQYESEGFNEKENHLYIKADVVFGAVEFKRK